MKIHALTSAGIGILWLATASFISAAPSTIDEMSGLTPEQQKLIASGRPLSKEEIQSLERADAERMAASLGKHWSTLDLSALYKDLEAGDVVQAQRRISVAARSSTRPNADLVILIELLHADAFEKFIPHLKALTRKALSEENLPNSRIQTFRQKNRHYLCGFLYSRALHDNKAALDCFSRVRAAKKLKGHDSTDADMHEEAAADVEIKRMSHAAHKEVNHE